MKRIYKCPICGKNYPLLDAMYRCAKEDEKKELNKEKEIKEKNLKEIKNKYKELKELIKNYNAINPDECIDIFMFENISYLTTDEVYERIYDEIESTVPPDDSYSFYTEVEDDFEDEFFI